ncbi:MULTISPECIES: LysR family transcriptional regulator [Actinoalloteichus]|uniref:Transcriptional regulator n=1 Tax=Actinoalloteichus fjordicus TaxID=1612552 RepID=A0AAC9LCE4_9PSEU|nr:MULTISPECIES: LysR family transcriptional regulator [Actinoalloteichus]APU14741.1 transcriptional regulator [Actinoalloteichus fjordicus]APU20710.1 transcriptional regulator [Actinoalloteichus sp. GBA129-24]
MEFRLLRYFVTVAEERHFGRAAVRLHMTQPPLSRAIRQLEADLGVVLLHRSATGIELTAAGASLYSDAAALLERVEQARARATAAAETTTLTVGTLSDGAGEAGPRLAATFRLRHPEVSIRFREADFTDPTTGLRNGLVDVALTRSPFDDTGISRRVLRSDQVGAVLRTDDPLAGRDSLRLADLAGRRWFQLPEGTDPIWSEYWNGATPVGERPAGPVVRTVTECIQAVLWNGAVGIAPITHALPDGLILAPIVDMPPSPLVVAWSTARESPLIRSFVQISVQAYRSAST